MATGMKIETKSRDQGRQPRKNGEETRRGRSDDKVENFDEGVGHVTPHMTLMWRFLNCTPLIDLFTRTLFHPIVIRWSEKSMDKTMHALSHLFPAVTPPSGRSRGLA